MTLFQIYLLIGFTWGGVAASSAKELYVSDLIACILTWGVLWPVFGIGSVFFPHQLDKAMYTRIK